MGDLVERMKLIGCCGSVLRVARVTILTISRNAIQVQVESTFNKNRAYKGIFFHFLYTPIYFMHTQIFSTYALLSLK